MRFLIITILAIIVIGIFFFKQRIAYSTLNKDKKDATPTTMLIQETFLNDLPFGNKKDFELTERGFIARPKDLIIRNKAGKEVWNLKDYSFIIPNADAPKTVNPSLWRQANLNMHYGLYKVTDRIYQVRGYDISNVSFIQGDTGWIVLDPLVSAECAKAALDLVNKHLGKRPVVAVVYSHSHTDHYGGVKGIVSEKEVKDGKVAIVAPKGFMKSVVSENVIAGNVMSRRAMYMFGSLLAKGPKGQVDAGLGKTNSMGTITLIKPTISIGKTGQELTIDGIKMIFQYTPNTEAPVEMNAYFPQFKTLWMAENCSSTLHNIYTLRGAQVRDALAWSKFINQAIELFGHKSDAVFTSHHWPRWGEKNVINFLKKQRDVYKYLHDQTLRLANQGYTMLEIAEMITLPKGLAQEWFNRSYYGTVNHNVKAVYQKYLGFYDGNPANLHPLPPVSAAKKYVEFMGGADAIIKKARKSYKKGEYRWVAQVMNHVVFADPKNQAARSLEADALEQLGYQAESGPWRCAYLMGAQELRQGIKTQMAMTTASPDTIRAMPVDTFLDYLSVRLNSEKAKDKKISMNLKLTDTNKNYAITVENSVLNYTPNKLDKKADVTIAMNRKTFNNMMLKPGSIDKQIASGDIKITGDKSKFKEFMNMLDTFDLWFNIVTP